MKTCKKCGQQVNPRKPDPCLGGYLEGIAHCCCGHGEDVYAYCNGWKNCQPNEGSSDWREENDPTFWCLRGQKAIEYMESIK